MTSTDEIPHQEDWKEYNPTETAYDGTYPAPADWVFDEHELLAAAATILERQSNDEDYSEIVRAMELVDPENDQTLN